LRWWAPRSRACATAKASLADAFATVARREIWLRNLHILRYHHGSWTNHARRRNRKLLLHRNAD